MKKIVVLGPESTGKSTLCSALAKHYNTIWCAEYAREYLTKHGTKYTYDDLLKIAKGQIELENKLSLEAKENFLFIDTDMYVMKVWCEYVFNNCHRWILNQIAERNYDLYLLCAPDIPWAKDEMREYPDEKVRKRLYKYYQDALIHSNVPWVNVHGKNEERLNIAVRAVERFVT